MPREIHLRVRTAISRFLSPVRIFVLSFAVFILAGAIFLYLPFSSPRGDLRFLDALFTATSAVCVTGLSVIDIGKDLSPIGQVISIILFQVGGLGIITFSAFLFELMGRGMSFKETEIVQTAFLPTPQREFSSILKWILLSTLIIEAIGTALLFPAFLQDFSSPTALYYAVYHAISAFNNCGFSLFSDNLVGYQENLLVNVVVMGLIILGGIGFQVQRESLYRLRGLTKRLSVHTRIVITSTAILIFSGVLFIYLFEKNHMFKEMPLGKAILISFFQSITPRTCGFNTVDISQFINPTILLLLILMFIGASPGSTGGGIKTTSFSLVFLMMWNRLKGNEEVNVFNRTIPREILTRTISIILASVFSVFVVTSVLLVAAGSPSPSSMSRHFFVEYLFETVSAYGTVGLSMGVTPRLNDIQKLGIIIMMFAGRVGPLTLAFSLSALPSRRGLTYSEESVMVG